MEKKTTFNKDLFQKAQDDGKVVVVSSWIKYCYSCAGQMKILQKAEKDFKNTLTHSTAELILVLGAGDIGNHIQKLKKSA